MTTRKHGKQSKASRANDGVQIASKPVGLSEANTNTAQTTKGVDGYVKVARTEYGIEYATKSEEWRKYCEALYVLRLPDKPNRRKGQEYCKRSWLQVIRDKRGEEAYFALRGEMMRIWNHRKNGGA